MTHTITAHPSRLAWALFGGVTTLGLALTATIALRSGDDIESIAFGLLFLAFPYVFFIALTLMFGRYNGPLRFMTATLVSGCALLACSALLYWFTLVRVPASSTDAIAGLWILLLQFIVAAPARFILTALHDASVGRAAEQGVEADEARER